MQRKIVQLLIAMLFIRGMAMAQMGEAYAGHRRAGVDIMWFKNFKNKKDERTPFLFFNRNRASVDYKKKPALFGSTNAVSYNFKNGLGLTVVGSFLQNGFVLKSGVQYYRQKKDFMFFGWLVADLKKDGSIDVFGLFRYQPKIKLNLHAFGQLELFPVYTPSTELWNITQRVRLGLKRRTMAAGFMADFNQTGINNFTASTNLGIFFRNEF